MADIADALERDYEIIHFENLLDRHDAAAILARAIAEEVTRVKS